MSWGVAIPNQLQEDSYRLAFREPKCQQLSLGLTPSDLTLS